MLHHLYTEESQSLFSHEAHASLSKLKLRTYSLTPSFTVLSVWIHIAPLEKVQEETVCQQDPDDLHKTFKGNISVTLTIKIPQY